MLRQNGRRNEPDNCYFNFHLVPNRVDFKSGGLEETAGQDKYRFLSGFSGILLQNVQEGPNQSQI
jgi:hypothetical protein